MDWMTCEIQKVTFGRAWTWIGLLDSSSQLTELLLYSTVKVNHAKKTPNNKFWRALPTEEGSRPLFIFPSVPTLLSLVAQHTYRTTKCSAQLMVSFKEELDLSCLVNAFGCFFFFWVETFTRGPQSCSGEGDELSREVGGLWGSAEVQKALCRLAVSSSKAASAPPLEVKWASGCSRQCQLRCAQAAKTSSKHLTPCHCQKKKKLKN